MSAINFVVRDVAGNISRGSVAGEGVPASLIVGSGADISLNLTRGQVISYTRQGQALEITLIDGRIVTIEGFFTMEGVSENELFLSADGFLTEVQLTQGAGEDYFASYVEGDGVGKFALNDDLYFMRGADVMLAEAFNAADDEVGMLGIAALGAPLLGLGGAAAAAGAAVLVGGGGGGGGGPEAPTVDITSGTEANDHTVNEEEHADGTVIGGTGTPGGVVDVVIGDVTETTTVDGDGNWEVTFDPADIEEGEYTTPVDVTITNEGGSTTVVDTLIVDTVIGVDVTTAGGDDGVINAVEHAAGVTLGGTVTGGDTVIVTINGADYTATVTGSSWSLDLNSSVLGEGEYTQDITVTATDAAGNSSTSAATIVVDTVTSVTVDTSSVGGSDNVVNGAEQANGVSFTGTAQAGASVEVTFGTVVQTVIADGNGNWSVSYAAGDVPTGELDVPVTAVATDAAGNTATATSSVAIDTVATVTVDTASVGGADNVVNGVEQAGGVTLNGTAQAGASVAVTFGTVTHTVLADSNGNWTSTYAAGNVPTGELDVPVNVTATDAAGNSASTSSSVTVDTFVNNLDLTSNSAGGADGVVNFNESSQSISMAGTVEAGSSVSVDLHGVVMAATVDANGNWSVTYPGGSLPGGEYTTSVTVTATDAAGNTSSLSEPVTVDTVAGDLALSTQPIEIDDVVNDAEHSDGVIINGTATPGLTVTVGLGNATLNVVAQPDGTWSVNFPANMVPEGTYESAITASITDAAGNFKEVSDTVQIDTEVVPFNFSANPIEGDDVINGAEAANGVVLSGQVEAGSSVAVEFGGQTITVVAGANGQWSANFPASAIRSGEFTASMTATATDPAGNVSVITDTVLVDTLVNELTSTDPVEGDNVVNRAEAEDGITLGGTVEAGSTVMVTFEGINRAATVDGAGNWTVTYAGSEIPGGEYDAVVTIAATDAHGNTDSITDEFRVDTSDPDAPGIESVVVTPGGVKAITIEAPENEVTVNEITSGHQTNELADETDGIALSAEETFFNFDTALPNGSHLVVNETDSAGNANATFVVLEETGTNAVDLGGLSGFDIGSIDLGFAQDAELVLDLATLEGLSDADNNLIIHGSDVDNDSVSTLGAADSGSSTVIDGKSFDIYTMGDDAQIFIEDGINVTI